MNKKITDIVEFNPTRKIQRGNPAPFVDMASLPVNGRDISKIEIKEFNGGGAKFKNGDTLFARITPCLENGKTAKVSSLQSEAVGHGSTEFIVMAAKEPEYDEDFVYYIARLPEFRAYATARMEGTSGRQRVPWQALAEFEYPFPDKDDRRPIAQILKSLDDKIENNRRMNESLEGMAQAIFKSWFVDFDPVRAKVGVLESGGSADDARFAAMKAISGKSTADLEALKTNDPKIYSELASTADAFPSSFTTSALGDIPEGWEASEIGNEVDVVGGGTPSTKNPEFWEDGTINWTTPRDMSNLNDKILADTERKITEAGLKKISSGLLPIDTVLMSSRAPVGYLAIAKVPVAINQGYIAMKCNHSLSPEYVIQWCSHNMDEIKQRASGTTFAEISKKSFNPIPVIVPSEKALKAYTQNIRSIYSKIEALIYENRSLIETRDSLLPKLLSGELSVEGLSENEE
ncbi:MAG: restriction endonuclease subunit S [Alphaproteobacteria bacterium]